MMEIYQVAVNFPGDKSVLDYVANETLKEGDIVCVPLSKRIEKGCIIGRKQEIQSEIKLKEIISFTNQSIPLNTIQLLKQMSKYYKYPLGKLIFDAYPFCETQALPKIVSVEQTIDFKLNLEQQKAVEQISSDGSKFYYLHGVTGSGKSLVYLDQIKKCLDQGKSVLYLVPEIGLLLSVFEFLKKSIHASLLLYHGKLTIKNKAGIWNFVSKNAPLVVIGVRSAVFLPIKNLSLMIIDEEHDSSYKQEERCPYHTSTVALMRSKQEDFKIIWGSATPSLDYYLKTEKSLIKRVEMHNRFAEAKMPKVHIASVGKVVCPKSSWPFELTTLQLIKKYFEQRKQIVIFLNKLGHSSLLECSECHFQFLCQKCSIPLKYFKKKQELKCSFCKHTQRFTGFCLDCNCTKMIYKGMGTEKIKEILQRIYPDANILRLDRDEVTTLKKFKTQLETIESGQCDIIVGTQIVSKGFNFKNVCLVVVLGIDEMLSYPDFWARERTYQLVTQVLGRAGRFNFDSEVVIQTKLFEDFLFGAIQSHSYADFYKQEIEIRSKAMQPPLSNACTMYFFSKNSDELVSNVMILIQEIKNLIDTHFPQIHLLGPRPTIIEKKNNMYSWCCVFLCTDQVTLHNFIQTILKNVKPKTSKIKLKVDIGPKIIY